MNKSSILKFVIVNAVIPVFLISNTVKYYEPTVLLELNKITPERESVRHVVLVTRPTTEAEAPPRYLASLCVDSSTLNTASSASPRGNDVSPGEIDLLIVYSPFEPSTEHSVVAREAQRRILAPIHFGHRVILEFRRVLSLPEGHATAREKPDNYQRAKDLHR